MPDSGRTPASHWIAISLIPPENTVETTANAISTLRETSRSLKESAAVPTIKVTTPVHAARRIHIRGPAYRSTSR